MSMPQTGPLVAPIEVYVTNLAAWLLTVGTRQAEVHAPVEPPASAPDATCGPVAGQRGAPPCVGATAGPDEEKLREDEGGYGDAACP